MVERSLSMREVRGSIPCFSIFTLLLDRFNVLWFLLVVKCTRRKLNTGPEVEEDGDGHETEEEDEETRALVAAAAAAAGEGGGKKSKVGSGGGKDRGAGGGADDDPNRGGGRGNTGRKRLPWGQSAPGDDGKARASAAQMAAGVTGSEELRIHTQQGWRVTENQTAVAASLEETIAQAEEGAAAQGAAHQLVNKLHARLHDLVRASRENTPDTTLGEPEELEQVSGAGAPKVIFYLTQSATIAFHKGTEEERGQFLEDLEAHSHVTHCERMDQDVGPKPWRTWVQRRDETGLAGPLPSLVSFKIHYSSPRVRDVILLGSVANTIAGNPMAGIVMGGRQPRVHKGHVGCPNDDIFHLQVDVRCYSQSTTANEVAKATQELTGAAKPEQIDNMQGKVLKQRHVAASPLVQSVVVAYARMDRSEEKDCLRFKVLIQPLQSDPRARRVQRVVYTAVGEKRFIFDCKLWSCPNCKKWLQDKRGKDHKVSDWEVSHTEYQEGECARFKANASAGGDGGGGNQAQ